jgi:hypothetical protein
VPCRHGYRKPAQKQNKTRRIATLAPKVKSPPEKNASRRGAETQREENEKIAISFFSPPRLCVSA